MEPYSTLKVNLANSIGDDYERLARIRGAKENDICQMKDVHGFLQWLERIGDMSETKFDMLKMLLRAGNRVDTLFLLNKPYV